MGILVGIACCSQGARQVPDDLKATTRTEHVRVFLIKALLEAPLESEAGGGRKASCDADAEPVEVTLPRSTPALEGALEGLFALQGGPWDTRSGLYNALHASPLTIEKIERRGAEATVRLHGYLELGERCDGQRALAQLTETVLQFPDVQRVQFYLEGKPLQGELAGK